MLTNIGFSKGVSGRFCFDALVGGVGFKLCICEKSQCLRQLVIMMSCGDGARVVKPQVSIKYFFLYEDYQFLVRKEHQPRGEMQVVRISSIIRRTSNAQKLKQGAEVR